MSAEAMKLALEALKIVWEEEEEISAKAHQVVYKAIDALEEALAKQEQGKSFFKFRECEDSQVNQTKQEQGEPVAWMFYLDGCNQVVLDEDSDADIRFNGVPLSTTPQQRTWVGLMRGIRVEGDTVVISVHYGNDAARQVCGALIEEMNT